MLLNFANKFAAATQVWRHVLMFWATRLHFLCKHPLSCWGDSRGCNTHMSGFNYRVVERFVSSPLLFCQSATMAIIIVAVETLRTVKWRCILKVRPLTNLLYWSHLSSLFVLYYFSNYACFLCRYHVSPSQTFCTRSSELSFYGSYNTQAQQGLKIFEGQKIKWCQWPQLRTLEIRSDYW